MAAAAEWVEWAEWTECTKLHPLSNTVRSYRKGSLRYSAGPVVFTRVGVKGNKIGAEGGI